eukprot:TRINITY_DN49895_c0_g1_i1.p1 TRINITY_DN49895_c0_g1~~TRINITY_DN49895_c0_g1_i1.p1  ORF type:complete len:483 (-),score=79.07 TRINITY_DN49895_c0_g1_i1:57-1505(-)
MSIASSSGIATAAAARCGSGPRRYVSLALGRSSLRGCSVSDTASRRRCRVTVHVWLPRCTRFSERSVGTVAHRFSSSVSRGGHGESSLHPASRAAWSTLPTAKRQAWEALGWTADSWEGKRPAPVTALRHWEELSNAEKAAASYGLGYTEESWNTQLEHAELSSLTCHEPTASKDMQETKGSTEGSRTLGQLITAARRGLPWVKTAAQLLPRGSKLRVAVDVVSTVAEAIETVDKPNAVVVAGTEEAFYLDDSGSMTAQRLALAQDLWREMINRLRAEGESNPTRIVKFGAEKYVLESRAKQISPTAVGMAWNGRSGSTYMWQMILDDVLDHYAPGPGRLRVFVITDGGDTDSPPPYNGMQGMNPMMQELRRHGFNIEFHIVFVSGGLGDEILNVAAKRFFGVENLTGKDLNRYRDLALATGGSFLHLSTPETTKDRVEFLDRLSRREDKLQQLEARRQYEDELQRGEATPFDWYQRLPPPK